MAKKMANEQLLEVFNKEIFDAEQNVKDAQDNLEELKEERKDLLRQMADEQNQLKHVIVYGGMQGFTNG